MVSLTLYTLYNYLQRSVISKATSLSFTTLLLQAHRKLSFYQTKEQEAKKKKPITIASLAQDHRLHILYPSRTQLLSSDSFFSSPKSVIQNQSNHIESIKKQSIAGKLTPHYIPPREPIVLCHGLFGFDISGPQSIPALQTHYWNGVEDTLAKLGAKVIVTKVPHAGTIWERSNALHTILKSILVGKNVNFVAYSMGGLDCRHLLANMKDRPYNVQSLTTICTPHRGSPFMDWVRENTGIGLLQTPHNHWPHTATSTMAGVTNTTLRHDCLSLPVSNKWTSKLPGLDKLIVKWFDEPGYAHLTTDFCNDYFNPNTPDDPTVKYYSYGAAAKLPAWSSLLGVPYHIIQQKEGDNDGFVSVKSAKWGNYIKTVPADHWDLSGVSYIPYRLRTSETKFDRLDFYAEMATRLYNQGH